MSLSSWPLYYATPIPINTHPGAFGAVREYDIHTGIDLYCHDKTEVHAIKDGIVVDRGQFTGEVVGSPWWNDTDYLVVHSKYLSGIDVFYLYGEIISKHNIGDTVKQGHIIGHVKAVLPNHKLRKDIAGHSVSMLHLEEWSKYVNVMKQPPWTDVRNRPHYLKDPTLSLININKFNCNSTTFLT